MCDYKDASHSTDLFAFTAASLMGWNVLKAECPLRSLLERSLPPTRKQVRIDYSSTPLPSRIFAIRWSGERHLADAFTDQGGCDSISRHLPVQYPSIHHSGPRCHRQIPGPILPNLLEMDDAFLNSILRPTEDKSLVVVYDISGVQPKLAIAAVHET